MHTHVIHMAPMYMECVSYCRASDDQTHDEHVFGLVTKAARYLTSDTPEWRLKIEW